MESLGFPSNWIIRPIIVLLAFVITFYLGAALILQFWKVKMSISRARKTEVDQSAGKENLIARSLEVRTVDIRLHKYSLDIQKRKLFFKKATKVSVLKSINTRFEPGLLNVIMGPSGVCLLSRYRISRSITDNYQSGKTSLLNLMARRLHNSISTKYETDGDMFFNGAVPSEGVIRSICSYVCQDDDSLLPYLTVRENLRFAAGLRLPTHMSKEEKIQRAESVLLKLGLRDCADNLVGSELVKGISGGEKRRVTIATQILTDPRILLFG